MQQAMHMQRMQKSLGERRGPWSDEKRKQASYPLQKHPLKGVGGMYFMEGLAESINLGSLTNFEFILLVEIVHELILEDKKVLVCQMRMSSLIFIRHVSLPLLPVTSVS